MPKAQLRSGALPPSRARSRVLRCAAALLAASALAGCRDGADAPWELDLAVGGSHFHGVHGITFDSEDRLYVGDVIGQAIYRVDPESQAATYFVAPPEGEADDLEFGPDGTLAWTAFFAGEVRARRPDGEIVTLASGHPGFNSLAFSPDGRLFATTVFLGDALYEIDLRGQAPARLIAENLGGLNGFDFGPDGALYGPLFTRGEVARVDVDTGEVEVIAEGFEVPAAVNLDSEGRIYVVDTARGEVVRVDPETGQKTRVAQVEPAIDNLAFDGTDRLFLTNMADNAIVEVDVASGSARTLMTGALSIPADVAYVDGGRGPTVLVPDAFAFRAVVLPNHEVFEIARMFGDELHFPLYVTTSEGHIAVSGLGIAGLSPGSVQLFDRESGESQAVWEGFEAPQDLVFEASGALLVAEYERGEILRLDPHAPEEREVVWSGLAGPVGLVWGPEGELYVTEYRSGEVSRLHLAEGTREVVAGGLAGPEGIDVFPDGRLAVAEVGARRIVALDPRTGAVQVLRDELPIGLAVPAALPAPGIPTGIAVVDDDELYFSSDLETALYRMKRPEP